VSGEVSFIFSLSGLSYKGLEDFDQLFYKISGLSVFRFALGEIKNILAIQIAVFLKERH